MANHKLYLLFLYHFKYTHNYIIFLNLDGQHGKKLKKATVRHQTHDVSAALISIVKPKRKK
jgi:hypothetical protein